MVFITVDTHVMERNDPNFYFEPKWNDKRDGYYAADIMAYDFVRWIQAQDFYEDTTVIVMGDHLTYLRNLDEVALDKLDAAFSGRKGPFTNGTFKEHPRTIFNTILNSAIMPNYTDTQTRSFGSFDMAPTILESVGAVLPDRRFGLGISLFSQEPTLFEKYGVEYYEAELRKSSILYKSFQ